jgi:dihydrofolate reductase
MNRTPTSERKYRFSRGKMSGLMMKVSLIAAVAENGVIGRDNDLPWKIRDDMKFFVKTTKGHPVIMGRLNFVAMGRALPGRRNIVVSRDVGFQAEGCESATSVSQALQMAAEEEREEAFVIGGAQIYQQALPYAHRLYLTRVLAEVEGDVFFPPVSLEGWSREELLTGAASEQNQHAFVVELWERPQPDISYDQVSS